MNQINEPGQPRAKFPDRLFTNPVADDVQVTAHQFVKYYDGDQTTFPVLDIGGYFLMPATRSDVRETVDKIRVNLIKTIGEQFASSFKWIDVKESLPPHCCRVVVWVTGGPFHRGRDSGQDYMDIGRYNHGKWQCGDAADIDVEVSHYMLVTAPPTEKLGSGKV